MPTDALFGYLVDFMAHHPTDLLTTAVLQPIAFVYGLVVHPMGA
ncbi:hypothetical protein ACXVUM_02195 [Williamsia sp. SKLECPSW1]